MSSVDGNNSAVVRCTGDESMKILLQKPPNYDLLSKAFPAILSTPTVVFAFGDTIYNPSGKLLPEEIVAHETVHSKRQLEAGVKEWWEQYLEDRKFRLEEEILAHVIEYEYVAMRSRGRNQRRAWLKLVSEKLASPIYGPMISRDKARLEIKKLRKEIYV